MSQDFNFCGVENEGRHTNKRSTLIFLPTTVLSKKGDYSYISHLSRFSGVLHNEQKYPLHNLSILVDGYNETSISPVKKLSPEDLFRIHTLIVYLAITSAYRSFIQR